MKLLHGQALTPLGANASAHQSVGRVPKQRNVTTVGPKVVVGYGLGMDVGITAIIVPRQCSLSSASQRRRRYTTSGEISLRTGPGAQSILSSRMC